MIQSEYGLTVDQYLDHTPREISEAVTRIMDRKSGYKISEMQTIAKFSDEQEERIKQAKLRRAAKLPK